MRRTARRTSNATSASRSSPRCWATAITAWMPRPRVTAACGGNRNTTTPGAARDTWGIPGARRIASDPCGRRTGRQNGSFSVIDAGWTAQAAQAGGTYARDWQICHSGPGSARLDVTRVRGGRLVQAVAERQRLGRRLVCVVVLGEGLSSAVTMTTHLYSDDCPESRCLTDQEIVLGTDWRRFEMPFSARGNSNAALNFIVGAPGRCGSTTCRCDAAKRRSTGATSTTAWCC